MLLGSVFAKVILCASEHIVQSYDIASEALNNFKKIHYMY